MEPKFLRISARASSSRAPAHVAAFLYCKLSGKRYVQWGEFTLRDGAQSSRIKRGLRRLLISGADGCVASSKDAHDAFAQYGADPASILTASMPFEAEELHERVGVCRLAHRESPAREQPSGPALLSVGQLIPRKGWDELFAIYREVVKARPDTVLLIAGDGPCRVAYERLVREAGWSRVRFLGHLDEARLAEQFALADLFLFPTRYDAYGLVLAEAMAAELPVVSSVHAAATRDLVEEGVTGYAIDPRDAEASAGTIVGLLALSGERRRAIGRAAYERVRSCDTKPTADRMVTAPPTIPSAPLSCVRSCSASSTEQRRLIAMRCMHGWYNSFTWLLGTRPSNPSAKPRATRLSQWRRRTIFPPLSSP